MLSISCPAACPGTAGDAGLGIAAVAGARYTYAVSVAPTATTYTITATAVAGTSQNADTAPVNCTVLTVAVANGAAAQTPAACWSN